MKRMVIGAAIAAVVWPAAIAQEGDSVLLRLQNALAFEWYYSNCEQASEANGMMLMGAAMIIAGQTVNDVEAARKQVHDGIAERFPDPAAACADYANSLAQQQ